MASATAYREPKQGLGKTTINTIFSVMDEYKH